MAEFTYTIDQEFGDHVIEERNNTSVIMRKIVWGANGDAKLDIRKYMYTDEGERMGKGISLTDAGANELTKELISSGYGETGDILAELAKREGSLDKLESIIDDIKNTFVDESDEYYDPKELLA